MGAAALAPAPLERWGWVVLVVGLLAGLPHGAVDHLLPALRLGRSPARTAVVVLAYAATAALAWLVLRTWPGPGLVAFVALSVWHFGSGEVAFDDARAGRPPRRDPLTALAAGGAALLLPILRDPLEVAPVVALLVPGSTGVVPPAVATTVVVGVLVASGLAVARAASARRWAPAGELVLLVLLGLTVPPLVAFGTYFGGWHAVRHVALLVAADPTSRDDLARGRLLRPLGRFCARTAAPTAAALALLAALWSLADGWQGFVAADLALLAGLTVPHAVVVAWWSAPRAGSTAQADPVRPARR